MSIQSQRVSQPLSRAEQREAQHLQLRRDGLRCFFDALYGNPSVRTERKIKMHTFQLNSHINENGILSVKLPKEWAEKDVNVLVVLEFLNQLKETVPQKENLSIAFDLLTQMPEDFMMQRQDDLPQERDEWA